jgi:hypothetical protein
MTTIVHLKQPQEAPSRYRPLFTMFYAHHPHQKISTTPMALLTTLRFGMELPACATGKNPALSPVLIGAVLLPRSAAILDEPRYAR